MRRVAPILAFVLLLSGCASAAPESPSSAAAASTVAVPDVAGLAGNDARDALKDAGFEVEFDAGEGTVILAGNWVVDASTPAAGESVEAGSTVTLSVSKPVTEQTVDRAAPATVTPSGLDVPHAISTCDQRGESEAPWGWNADFLMDGTQLVNGDSVLLKAGVTITNAYDAEGRFTVECRVSGTNEAPVIDEFSVY